MRYNVHIINMFGEFTIDTADHTAARQFIFEHAIQIDDGLEVEVTISHSVFTRDEALDAIIGDAPRFIHQD